MRRQAVDVYRCPYTGEALRLLEETAAGANVLSGRLVSAGGRSYEIKAGIPLLIDPDDELLGAEEEQEQAHYQAESPAYDAVIDWMFQSFYEDEAAVRGRMVDLLDLEPGARVLETGAGTCRDSAHIAGRLGPDGELYALDLSPNMLALGRKRMEASAAASPCATEYLVANAASLPFPDGSFDAAFHFGGVNLFTDKRRCLAEMARVVRVGGKVVCGDEGVAPWLRGRPYGDVLMHSNRLYRYTPPTECLPECAREVCVRWLLGSAHYVLDFRVGDGPPLMDLDRPIPGRRGGSRRTRYYGVLDGVTVEAKEMAMRAAQQSGLTVHEWLDRAVRVAAATAHDLSFRESINRGSRR